MILGATGVALVAPRPANACSPPVCWPAAFVPGHGGRVPANVPGLYWRPMSGYGANVEEENVVLEDVAAPGVSIALTEQELENGDYLLVPETPLVAGHQYRLTDRNECMGTMERGPEVVFAVGPAAPLPSSLGELSASAEEVVNKDLATASGSCFAEARIAQTEIALVPEAAAAPWVDVLHFETMVDGRPWHYYSSIGAMPAPGTSPDGRARDRVFVVCASKDPWIGNGLAEGTHTVTMRATLPGTAQVISSSSVEVKLSCAETPQKDAAAHIGEKGGCSTGGSNTASGVGIALMALVRRRSRAAGRSAGSLSVPRR
jgi:hypothetical protein